MICFCRTLKNELREAAGLLRCLSLCRVKLRGSVGGHGTRHCFNKSLSTAPALASAETGTGVKVGRASEMGFINRCPPEPPEPELASRGTAAERGARKGLDSPARLPTAAAPVRREAYI